MGTTVRSLKIVTTLKIGSKECRVCAFYLQLDKVYKCSNQVHDLNWSKNIQHSV